MTWCVRILALVLVLSAVSVVAPRADQTDPRLDELFGRLHEVEGPGQVRLSGRAAKQSVDGFSKLLGCFDDPDSKLLLEFRQTARSERNQSVLITRRAVQLGRERHDESPLPQRIERLGDAAQHQALSG